MQNAVAILARRLPLLSETLDRNASETPLQREERIARAYNESRGHMDAEDGYSCEKCKNRGYFQTVMDRGGMLYQRMTECSCMNARRSLGLLRKSGLTSEIRECTFDSFRTDSPWQAEMLRLAKAYVKDGLPCGSWLFLGGAPGCGKTRLCTTVAREALLQGKSVAYLTWPQVSRELKALSGDAEEHARKTDWYRTADVLFVDDLWKPGSPGACPSDADVRLAYELVNHRYIAHKAALIATELSMGQLLAIDEAVGSRIAQRSRGYSADISRGEGKNQRL